ncbi:RidA family protein [Actinophytocola oryzae]|uniref:Enamine deaminase RidA (YjgF/YER057c/UK114 family) n=1 Tax=Actinophytocola oryzae TaxID=502181 RepID=A0A4R7VR91_9PSEU|nr:RidA family protein [Actinophytocola oryzae]TDV51879.1 enamine deaminase RidA (YjgF/YER057c/UK114 family) [Actinophytocola oryzae]
MPTVHPIDAGVSRHIGTYSDAVRIPAGHDLVVTSGTPGLLDDGTTPEDFADEARRAWVNVERALTKAGASLTDIVSARTWLTSADDVATYVRVRDEFITHRPTYMLAVVPQVVWPNLRLEIEVTAAVQPS